MKQKKATNVTYD